MHMTVVVEPRELPAAAGRSSLAPPTAWAQNPTGVRDSTPPLMRRGPDEKRVGASPHQWSQGDSNP